MCDLATSSDFCAGEAVGSVAGAAAQSTFDAFFEKIADGCRTGLEAVSSFWMSVPSPAVASGSGSSWTGSQTILAAQSWVSPLALVVFVITLGLALTKIAYDTRHAAEGSQGIVRSLVVTLASGVPLLALTMLGITFGDLFSPWVLAQASGQPTSGGFSGLFVKAFLGGTVGAGGAGQAAGALLIIYLLAIIGSLVQCVFMVVRSVMVIVLLSTAQVFAAGTATAEGWLRFKRIGLLLLGFILYKPAAALVLGVSLKLLSDGSNPSQALWNAIYGLTGLVVCALALPAMIKFVAPVAAMGSSSAFSGGAAVGAIAAGAAVVALAGATGGAGAGAAAGAGSTAAPAGAGPDPTAGSAGSGGGGGKPSGASDAAPTGSDGPSSPKSDAASSESGSAEAESTDGASGGNGSGGGGNLVGAGAQTVQAGAAGFGRGLDDSSDEPD